MNLFGDLIKQSLAIFGAVEVAGGSYRSVGLTGETRRGNGKGMTLPADLGD
jgi:hypothetical protein